MAITQFVISPDGTRLAYDIQGQGQPLLLIHGFTVSRRDWHSLGWVARLQKYFTVITVDMRGRGESDKPTSPEAYRIDRLIEDVLAVAEAAQAEDFYLLSHSWGGSISLHLAARSPRVRRAVIAGTSFGPIFSDESINEYTAFLQNLARFKAENRLAEITEPNRTFAATADFPVLIASNEGLRGWPGVLPAELLCPTLVYVGTVADRIAASLREYQHQAEATNGRVQLAFFEGLDHSQEVTALDRVFPAVLTFLTGH